MCLLHFCALHLQTKQHVTHVGLDPTHRKKAVQSPQQNDPASQLCSGQCLFWTLPGAGLVTQCLMLIGQCCDVMSTILTATLGRTFSRPIQDMRRHLLPSSRYVQNAKLESVPFPSQRDALSVEKTTLTQNPEDPNHSRRPTGQIQGTKIRCAKARLPNSTPQQCMGGIPTEAQAR
jgi:hypothetical protein